MILLLILKLFLGLLTFFPFLVTTIFPFMDNYLLPFGIDAILVQGMGYVRFLSTVFPPVEVLLEAIVIVIMWKMLLKFIAMIPVLRNLLHKTN